MRVLFAAFVVSLAGLLACGDGKTATPDAAPDIDAVMGPACADNVDNDGDGKVDYPADPGCPAPNVDDETDPCPSGAGCPQCGDGNDNDGNGKLDFPEDSTGCTSASDVVEFTLDPNACGSGLVIKPLTGAMEMGTLSGTTSMVTSPCGGGNGLPAVAYVINLTSPKVLIATTDDPMTTIDTVIDLRTSMCTSPGAELTCHDDLVPSGTTLNRKSKITKSLAVGNYYLIVSGKTAADTGTYALKTEFLAGEGSSCSTADDCGPELVCRVPAGQTAMICTGPVCDDTRDDDGDGKIDFPIDPGCTSRTDDTEDDVCNTTPNSPMCPECGNGADDDGDGQMDFPNDTQCRSAASTSEACPVSEAVGVITQAVTTGTTVGAIHDYTPTCNSGNTAPDVTYRLDLPAMTTLNLNLTGFDTVHALLDSTCAGTALACSDASLMTRTNVTAGTYYVVIDGWSTNSGTWTLNTTGTVAPNGSCEGALFQSGAFTCTAGYACGGTAGSRTCRPAACNDTMDNDGDGKTDYPSDPGCAGTSDGDETDDCSPTVGPNCPACANMLDDDADNQTDYPMDNRCPAASFFVENFCSPEVLADIAGMVQTPVTVGTLVGRGNNLTQSCQGNTGNDITYGFRLPVPVTTLHLDTLASESSDTVLSFWNVSCTTQLGCDDDSDPNGLRSILDLPSVPAGDYAIQVDSYSTSNNQGVTLTMKGTVAAGTACTHPMFASGLLVCPTNTTCTAGVCQ